MRTADFDYVLPPERIAQRPADPRDSARLLLVDRHTGATSHRLIRDLPSLLTPGDVLVVNASRVIPARLYGHRETGGRVEVLMLHARPDGTWEALLRPGRRIRKGELLTVEGGARFTFLGWDTGVALVDPGMDTIALHRYLDAYGQTPFPPYIAPDASLKDRYQTVYAHVPGSVAAPTAGLHFTPELLASLDARGVRRTEVVLHVGLGTFLPVTVKDVAEHVMHEEWYDVPQEAADVVNAALREGRRVVAVGTTSVRVLESATTELDGAVELKPGSGSTRIFLTPGSPFRVVSALLTNFHLPRSTLLMLVSAFAGREHVLAAYDEAIREGYRFYSFGDAMLVS